MSTNAKNVTRPEFLKNFTTKIKRRYILVETAKSLSLDYQKIVNEVNTKLNQIIQEINLKIHDRQVPYITLITQFNTSLNERSRVVIHNQFSSSSYIESVKDQTSEIGYSVSHCVDLLICEGYREIVVSTYEYDAEIVVGFDFITCAIIDLLLDIAMFNSYSFLKEKPTSWKHNFGFEKYNFFMNEKMDCFYECKTNKQLYYSFAFSARRSKDNFDVEHYIGIWEEFILQNYKECEHCEKTIFQQLQQHVDFKELPASLAKELRSYPAGAYLILRTNKDRTESLQPFICAAFGLEEYEKGRIKIIPISEFERYKSMFENLDVSAFKVVVSPTDCNKITDRDNGKNNAADKKRQSFASDVREKKRFRIALSFPGEHRCLVDAIACELVKIYDKKSILYDQYLQAELARPNLDTYLQKLYEHESELIVVFICAEYNEKMWCGIEWRAIRRKLNKKCDDRIMLIKCGEGLVDGLDENTDGYIDASTASINSLVENIVERYNMLR